MMPMGMQLAFPKASAGIPVISLVRSDRIIVYYNFFFGYFPGILISFINKHRDHFSAPILFLPYPRSLFSNPDKNWAPFPS
jgi:hypothetical protein